MRGSYEKCRGTDAIKKNVIVLLDGLQQTDMKMYQQEHLIALWVVA